jgi:hypothetical protein
MGVILVAFRDIDLAGLEPRLKITVADRRAGSTTPIRIIKDQLGGGKVFRHGAASGQEGCASLSEAQPVQLAIKRGSFSLTAA